MIGPVSGTGRAMMASLQQAIQKGMPPDQAIQYVKSMATQGVAPLADLYAMMNQFQRLKQPPVQAPQTPPTIRDQLNMAEQQQAMMQQGVASLPAPAMEQAQFAGGGIVAFEEGGHADSVESEIERLEEALRADDYIKQGLGGSLGRAVATRTMPMAYAQRLEAEKKLQRLKSTPRSKVEAEPDFSPSGPPVKPEFRLPSDYGILQQPAERGAAPDIFAMTSAPAAPPAPPTPPAPPAPPRVTTGSRVPAAPAAPEQLTREEMENREYERIQQFRKREGIGTASENMRQFLSDENNRLAEQFGQDKMLAFAEAGFKMAAAASSPGATFLGALSEGAISGTQALRGLQKEMAANRRGIQESMLKLQEAEELRKEGDFKSAMQIAQQARTEMFERQRHADNLRNDERKISILSRGQELEYGAKVAATGAAANRAAINAQIEGLDLDYKDQQEIANDTTRTLDERQNARANMAAIRRKRDQLASGSTLSGASGGAGNPYSNLSDEQILAALSR